MGSSSTDVWIVACAVVGVLANVAALVVVAAWHGLLWAALLIAAMLFAALLLIWVKVKRRERLLARFIDACAFDDVSQVFGPAEANNDPRSLGGALNRAMQRLAKERTALVIDSRLNAAFVDSTPVPVVTVSHTGTVHLINRSARQLFRGQSRQNVSALATHGQAFVDALLMQEPGSRKEVSIVLDDVPQKALLTISRLRVGDEDMRIVAIQPIQGALDETEVNTQRDLVRVLTHEIMNSITPVTSLARTSAGLLQRMDQAEPDVSKATRAIMTLADRAEGIMAFVASYRQISRPMTVNRREFAAIEWVGEVGRLFQANPDHAEIAIETRIEPNHFRLNADANLLTQLALNLLRNSAEAAGPSGRVTLRVERSAHGRARITVEDDGPGIDPDKRKDVFLPFFTTKANGSGVGLSLARQIALAHGGTITASNTTLGGAAISVLL